MVMNSHSNGAASATPCRAAFDTARDAIVVLDRHGELVLSNDAVREMPWGLVERLVDSHATGRPPELEAFRSDLEHLGVASFELRFEGRDVEIEGRVSDGYTVVSLRDVTVARRLERDLRALERMHSLAHLTASLVHDFNNLLTPMACLGSVLEADLPAGPAREMARDIRVGTEKAAELARQTLVWARHRPSSTDSVDVVGAVRDLRPLLARVAGAEVDVEVHLSTGVEAASVDRERLEHALINLAANARDAMPSGGRLSVTVKTVSFGSDLGGEAAPDGASPGAYVAVFVSDTGLGMKPEVKERLFELFFTTKEPGRGTGLGLAAVKRFVDESAGFIRVQSEEGHGTTVSMYLPVARLKPTWPPPSPRGPAPRGTETVLVVDDDAQVRRAMVAVLEGHGYRVTQAASAEEAIAIVGAARPPFDAAVVDVVMPAVGGAELARRLRELRDARALPILFTSGHTEERLARTGLRPQDGALLRKAFTPTELLHALREVLDD
jgi:signal transduction histidine kinase